jgi:hypothetical protein
MTTMTGTEWCERYGVAFDWSANGFQVDKDGWEYHDYTSTLTREDKTLILPYHTGVGVEESPTADDLWNHSGDVRDGALDFDDYAREFGLASDPNEASVGEYRTWETCRKIQREVYAFCASQQMYEDFCAIRERD